MNYLTTNLPNKHRTETITPAMRIPRKFNQKPSFGLILKSVLATAPVQAPVIGNGIPTKITKPNFPHFAYEPENAFSVFRYHQSKNFLKNGIFDK